MTTVLVLAACPPACAVAAFAVRGLARDVQRMLDDDDDDYACILSDEDAPQ